MTHGEKIPPALITEIGKRADLVSMLHLHHSQDFASPTPRLRTARLRRKRIAGR